MLAIDETTLPVQTASEGCSSKGSCQDVLIPLTPSIRFHLPARPVPLLLPPSRVYWGTSDCHLWQYEVEIPSCLIGGDEHVAVVRLRPLNKIGGDGSNSSGNDSKRQAGLASCLIGCRLVEFSKEGVTMGLRGPVLTSILVCPSSTWVSPCRLALSFIPTDFYQPNMSRCRLGLWITLAISDVSYADRVEILSPIVFPS